MKKLRKLLTMMVAFVLCALGLMTAPEVKAADYHDTAAMLGPYTSAADSSDGRAVSLAFTHDDEKIAERFKIRATKTSATKLAGKKANAVGSPVFKVTNDAKYSLTSNSSNGNFFNFKVVEKNYTLQKDQFGNPTLLKLECSMTIPAYSRQLGVGDDNFISKSSVITALNGDVDKLYLYDSAAQQDKYGRCGAYDIKSDGTQGSKLLLPRHPETTSKTINFYYTINIGNFRMNEKTNGTDSKCPSSNIRCKNYRFQYNKLGIAYNMSGNVVNKAGVFTAMRDGTKTTNGTGWFTYVNSSGVESQVAETAFKAGSKIKVKTASEAGISKTGYVLAAWRDTVNGNVFVPGQSYDLNNFASYGTSPRTVTLSGSTSVDSSNPGYDWKYKNVSETNTSKTIIAELIPVWKLADAYKIDYVLNGGYIANGTNPTSFTVETPSFTLYNPVRPGYAFEGWRGNYSDGMDIPGIDPEGSETVSVPKGSTGSRVYEALWSPAWYSIELNLNGGEVNQTKTAYFGNPFFGKNDGVNYKYDNRCIYSVLTPSFSIYNPIKANYDFAGWSGYYVADNGTTNYALQDGSYKFVSTTPKTTLDKVEDIEIPQGSTGNYNLTAQWTPTEFPITYDLDGGTLGGKTNPSKYTIETPTFTLNNPTKYGYDFVGWEGTGILVSSDNVSVVKGSTGSRHYKALWVPTKYNITYDLHDGHMEDGVTNPSEYTIETPDFTLNNPKRNGYAFLGWKETKQNMITENTNPVTVQKGKTGDLHFVADWEPIKYKIGYDLVNGHLETGVTNPNEYTIETPDFKINNPVRDGYTFEGWVATKSNVSWITDKTVDVTVKKGTYGNLYFTANWKPIKYEIEYDLAGGTLGNKTNPDEYTIETDDFDINNPTRKGYEFLGWTAEKAKDKEHYSAWITDNTKNVTVTKGTYGNLKFLAHWKEIKYTITYVFNGLQPGVSVDNSANPTTYTVETPTFTLVNPSVDKYIFNGWSLDKNADKGDMEFEIKKGTTGDLVIYGNFERVHEKFTITFDLKGGKSKLDKSDLTYDVEENNEWGSVNEATPIKDNNNFTKDYYKFVKWTYKDGKSFKFTDLATENVTVYANWEPVPYPVTYVLHGGNEPIPGNPPSVTVETPETPLNNPTKDGYEFIGWTGANGTTPQTNAKILEGTHEPLTFEANWKPCEYKITYDLQGGNAPVPDNRTGYNVDTPTFTLNNPTKDGYEFIGWTGSNGSEPNTKTSVVQGTKGDLHFVANWKVKPFTITYKLNGGKDPKNPKEYTKDTPDFTLKNPTKKGYIFTGWAGTGIDISSKKVTVKKGSTGNRTYEAIWEPKMSKLPRLKATDKEINLGSNTYRFIVYGENKKGGKKHVWKAVDMKGKPSKVISVSKNGTIKTKKCGKAMVQYKLYDKKGRMIYGFQSRVKVIDTSYKTLNTSKKIKVNRPTLMFDKTITVKNKKGFPLKWMNRTKDSKVTYKSSNKKVLTVSKNGIAKAKKAGFSLVTVTLKQDGVVYNYKIHFKCETSLNK